MNDTSPHLDQEVKITWLDDPRKFPYLREKFELHALRARFPMTRWKKSRTHKLMGYSEISVLAKAIHGRFYRRLWWVKLIPPDRYSEGCPGEAVIPSSVSVGKSSKRGRH
jgi:hypothetical protein